MPANFLIPARPAISAARRIADSGNHFARAKWRSAHAHGGIFEEKHFTSLAKNGSASGRGYLETALPDKPSA